MMAGLPKLPETHFVLFDHDHRSSHEICFDDTRPGTELWQIAQDMIDGVYTGEPLAVYRVKEDEITRDVSDEVCAVLTNAYRKGTHLSNQAKDFLSYCGHEIQEAAE
jgi:hypothetical protein